MADILLKVDETVLPDIAKAIMSKTGKTEPLKITQFASEITSITGGGNASFFIEWNPQKVPFKGYEVLNIDYIDSGISVAEETA